MCSKKVKTKDMILKSIKRRKKVLIAFEALFGALVISLAIIMLVPSAKLAVVKALVSTDFGKSIVRWLGSKDYDGSVLDTNFDSSKLKKNNLKYNYSDEYTNFVMFGVDSRNGEVDASNSDSILIVSIHNTNGEVKMVSVYRDTLAAIYDGSGQLNRYFKINSAYAFGGPEGAINTLNMNMDLDITDYVTVNFSGVAEIIDTLGGIRVNLTEDERYQLNYHLKSTITSTGKKASYVKKSGKDIKLNGIQATTYCRIRKATFYDPDTGEAVSNDFGRAARQRSVIMKLVERAKKASITELEDMISTVLDDDTESNRIISTSFTFDEIVNLLPVIFDFELSGSQGFPSTLATGTLDGASYVIAKGTSANVTDLHRFLYGEEDYIPTSEVQSINNYISGYTGINENSPGGYSLDTPETENGSDNTEEEYFDYDDKGKSDFY